MAAKHAPDSTPLSDTELAMLAELLDEHAAFDTVGLLGVLHAVAVAPGLVPPSAWIPVVVPKGPIALGKTGTQEFFGLVFRLYNEVLQGVATDEPIMPPKDDVPACTSFAAGFVAGAELDPEWIGDAERWTFASWAGYLAGRLDVVPPATRAKLAEDPTQTTSMICRDMGALVVAAHHSFLKLRRPPPAQAAPAAAAGPVRADRVGRNEPCPCGSGKKYKRCCIDAGAS